MITHKKFHKIFVNNLNIDLFFTQLNTMYCSKNQITEIPNVFTQLNKLYCCDTKITNIPSTFTELNMLQCDDNVLIPQNIREQL